MALDSESRWRLVRMKRAKGELGETNAEPVIRKATEADLTSMVEIYNYYIQNSVVTFDMDVMALADWAEKFRWITELGLPFIVAQSPNGQIIGFAYVAPWRQKAAFKRTVEDSIYLRPAAIGKRVGTRLLQELLDQAKAAGFEDNLDSRKNTPINTKQTIPPNVLIDI